MLDHGAMRLVLGVALLASMTSLASAGTYLGVGVGSEASGSGTYGRNDVSMDGYDRSGRLMLGTRFSKLSVEAQGSRFDVAFNNNAYDATQLALALKLSIPLGNNFEVFGKGGVQRTWLSFNGTNSDMDAAGSGLLFAAGFEYRFNLVATAASLFVDYQHSDSGYRNGKMVEFDGTSSMWTLGATVSL